MYVARIWQSQDSFTSTCWRVARPLSLFARAGWGDFALQTDWIWIWQLSGRFCLCLSRCTCLVVVPRLPFLPFPSYTSSITWPVIIWARHSSSARIWPAKYQTQQQWLAFHNSSKLPTWPTGNSCLMSLCESSQKGSQPPGTPLPEHDKANVLHCDRTLKLNICVDPSDSPLKWMGWGIWVEHKSESMLIQQGFFMLGKSSSRLQKMIEKCSQQLGDARRRCDTCKAPLASSVWRHGSTSWIWFQSWFLTMVLWSMVIVLLSKCGPWSQCNRHESQFPVKRWFCKRNDSAKIGTCARLCGFFSKVAAWKRLVKQSPLWNWKHLTQVIAVGWFRSSPLSWFTSKKFAYKDRFQEGLDGWKCSMQVWTTNPVRMDDLAAWSRQAVNEKLDLKNDAQQHTRPSHPRMKWLCGTNTDTPYYHQQMAKAARTTWKAHIPSFFPLADWPPVCLHHTSPEMNLSATLSFAAGFECIQFIVALRKHH